MFRTHACNENVQAIYHQHTVHEFAPRPSFAVECLQFVAVVAPHEKESYADAMLSESSNMHHYPLSLVTLDVLQHCSGVLTRVFVFIGWHTRLVYSHAAFSVVA